MSKRGMLESTLLVVGCVVLALVAAAAQMVPGGDLADPYSWLVALLLAAGAALSSLGIDRALYRERLRPGPGGRDALTVWIAVFGLPAALVIAGLQRRIVPPGAGLLRVAGLLTLAIGILWTFWCMRVNRYFSSVVRLQSERGHRLVEAGPYRVVRHPGYAGMLVILIGLAAALASSWAAAVLVGLVVVLLRRAVVEEHFLGEQLPGYADYRKRVRYRMFPGIW